MDNNSVYYYLNQTNLPSIQEISYQIMKNNSPFANDPGLDYDYRGYFKRYGTLNPNATNGHLSDEFKKNNTSYF